MNEFKGHMDRSGFKRIGHWEQFLDAYWRKEHNVQRDFNLKLSFLLFKRRVLHVLLKWLLKSWRKNYQKLDGYEYISPVPEWTFMGKYNSEGDK